MKKLFQAPLLPFTICFLVLILGILLVPVESGTVQLIPNEEAVKDPLAGVSTQPNDFYGGKININTASAEQLALLPGIGEGIAEAITAYREVNGLFHSIDELRNIEGIGQKRMEEISNYITVGGQS